MALQCVCRTLAAADLFFRRAVVLQCSCRTLAAADLFFWRAVALQCSCRTQDAADIFFRRAVALQCFCRMLAAADLFFQRAVALQCFCSVILQLLFFSAFERENSEQHARLHRNFHMQNTIASWFITTIINFTTNERRNLALIIQTLKTRFSRLYVVADSCCASCPLRLLTGVGRWL